MLSRLQQDYPLVELSRILTQAAHGIMKIYTNDFDIMLKADKSPLTEADTWSHEFITQALKTCSNAPILSEENVEDPKISPNQDFWLLDPLDGTKEFINRNGEFTINLGLIRNQKPVFGMIYIPAQKLLFFGAKDYGAWLCNEDNLENALKLPAKSNHITLNQDKIYTTLTELNVVGSRSHTSDFKLEDLFSHPIHIKTLAVGSALKFTYLLEGKAEVYFRMTPTCIWDTAAGHALLEALDYQLLTYPNLEPLTYHVPHKLNPGFLCF
ncbi:MAG: 3'(2'),5'-bisphosphate nucleotidase CysQ [Chitinophagales bacterium]|jgi:3'(2'), 5'-bisphosphate nucleotidase|nr:3'(2'),5'-bisphosphate nucleotidase CysQ [Chitinophagales bacterium]